MFADACVVGCLRIFPIWVSFRFSIERATASLQGSESIMLCQKKKQLNALARTGQNKSFSR
ncbi:MAG: hypothetical protein DME32_10310 [Verrucomicrobia bacterium]|nr:MAG: hypothetical protein DME32_10310 [Verrucomicrobiota bacterium]